MTCSTAVVAGCSLEKLALLRTSRSCSIYNAQAEDRQQRSAAHSSRTQPHDHAWRSCGRPRRVGAEDSRSSSRSSRSSRSSNTHVLYVWQFVQLQRDSSKIADASIDMYAYIETLQPIIYLAKKKEKETFIYYVAIEEMPYTNVLEIDVSTHISIIHPLIIGRVQRRRRRTRRRRGRRSGSSRANSKEAGTATAARRAQQQSANLRSQHIYGSRVVVHYIAATAASTGNKDR
uniref:Uncharacterized protein n=1 Tax=Trichogramma kaykai TaxID=54128 RepID=A0ABD2WWX3_9HYME